MRRLVWILFRGVLIIALIFAAVPLGKLIMLQTGLAKPYYRAFQYHGIIDGIEFKHPVVVGCIPVAITFDALGDGFDYEPFPAVMAMKVRDSLYVIAPFYKTDCYNSRQLSEWLRRISLNKFPREYLTDSLINPTFTCILDWDDLNTEPVDYILNRDQLRRAMLAEAQFMFSETRWGRLTRAEKKDRPILFSDSAWDDRRQVEVQWRDPQFKRYCGVAKQNEYLFNPWHTGRLPREFKNSVPRHAISEF